MSKVHTSNWTDAQEMAKLHPDTFSAPSAERLETIAPGTSVKISDGDERFWTTVESVEGDTLVGKVDNNLLGSQSYSKIGSRVQFKRCHVYDVQQEDEAKELAGIIGSLIQSGASTQKIREMTGLPYGMIEQFRTIYQHVK